MSEAEPVKEENLVSQSEIETLKPQLPVEKTTQLEASIRLLEEKLIVNRTKHKLGEIVVRKEVETRMVEVPVRSEKIIVEQVGAPNQRLAEIKLGEGTLSGVELADSAHHSSVKGEFLSPEAVSNLLGAIAAQKPHGCKKIRVEIVLEDATHQAEYQAMFDRCTQG